LYVMCPVMIWLALFAGVLYEYTVTRFVGIESFRRSFFGEVQASRLKEK
jgi:hypothetical protein